MHALFEQFPLLLPALGIVFAASLVALFWVGVCVIGERLHRAEQAHRSGRLMGTDLGSGGAYESSKISCESGTSADLGGGDCGGDGGGGGD